MRYIVIKLLLLLLLLLLLPGGGVEGVDGYLPKLLGEDVPPKP